jgi:uncharacterized protein YgiM (DUF1202 family)
MWGSAGSRSVFVFALTLAVTLSGCAAIDSAERAITGKKSETFYSASAGLPVRAAAFATSKVISRLALHEKVTRTELDRGFAHIVTAKGVEGWVDNSQLLWKVPTAKEPAQQQSEEPTAPAATDVAPATSTDEPAPVADPEPAPAVEPAPVAAPDPPAEPKKRAPATYDPF